MGVADPVGDGVMSKRHLILSGGVRDMSRAQFLAALERNGFSKPVLLWSYSLDDPSLSYSLLFDHKGRILRRASLAHLIQSRAERRAERHEAR